MEVKAFIKEKRWIHILVLEAIIKNKSWSFLNHFKMALLYFRFRFRFRFYPIIVIGDLNERLGNNYQGMEEYMGTSGGRERERENGNGNGRRIVETFGNQQLVLRNTRFGHKSIDNYRPFLDR